MSSFPLPCLFFAGTELPRLKYSSRIELPVDADCINKFAGICDVFRAGGFETRVLKSHAVEEIYLFCLLLF